MEDIPVPIPNTEVKLHSAESSWGIAPCEGRTLPCGGLAQLGERLPYKQRVTGSSPVSSINNLIVVTHTRWLGSSVGRATD